MKERPILFSGEMARAILEGKKTQTRRVIKPQPPADATSVFYWWHGDMPREYCAESGCYYRYPRGLASIRCPYGEPFETLWVRETWAPSFQGLDCIYRADPYDGPFKFTGPWKPSIYMPKWASRIFLMITGVRVERVRNINFKDCLAEGVINEHAELPFEIAKVYMKLKYQKLWDSINAKRGYSWIGNPWVWVIEFEVVEKKR